MTGKAGAAGQRKTEEGTVDSLKASIEKAGFKTDTGSLTKYLQDHGQDENDPLAKQVNLYAQHVQKLRELKKQEVTDNLQYWQDLMSDDEAQGNLSLQRKAGYLESMAHEAQGHADVLRGINRQIAENNRAIAREQAENAKHDVEEMLRAFQEKQRLEADDIRAEVDVHKMSEAEAARHYANLAQQIADFRRQHADVLGATDYGKTIDKGLQTAQGGFEVSSAQASKEDQRQKDQAVAEATRQQLEHLRSIHEAYEQQMADVERLKATIESSNASQAEKTKELTALEDERARLQQKHAEEQAAAQEKLMQLEEKIESIRVKRLEKQLDAGKVDQNAVAAEIQKQADVELGAIETKRQRAIAANGDVAGANAEAAAAQLDLYARQSDAIDTILAKQDKMAEKAANAFDKPLSAKEAFGALNQETESRWYGEGSPLKPFSLDISPSSQQDTSPLGQLKARFDSLGSSTSSLDAAFKALAQSAGKAPGGAGGSTAPALSVSAGVTQAQKDAAADISPRTDPSTMGGGGRFIADRSSPTGLRDTVNNDNKEVNVTNTVFINGVSAGGGEFDRLANAAGRAAARHMQSQSSLPTVTGMADWNVLNPMGDW